LEGITTGALFSKLHNAMWPKPFIAIMIGTFLASLAAGGQELEKASPPTPTDRSEANSTVSAAMSALQQGDYAGAIPPLEKLTAMAPDVPEYQADLCVAYYSAGRPQDAVITCRKALKLRPALAPPHHILAVSLAESGDCKGALPLLAKDYPKVTDQQMRRIMGVDGTRCAMRLNEPYEAVNFLAGLSRDFPNDPDVLYLSTHIFSNLSTRASQHLLQVAPGSYQAHQLNAEVLEIQDKFTDAIAEYRRVLTLNPHLAGIHYRIGRLLLGGERGPGTLEAARKEFEEELQIISADPGSEYELGEMAREARNWNDAIEHFGRAVSSDPSFPPALVGLGKSLVSAGRPAEAVAPLENAVKLTPGDPVAHYQLSFAYRRVGRDAEAQKELTLYRQLFEEQQRASLAIRTGILGDISRPQTAEPPE
jgi:Flp pilus assembly protein TadD